MRMTRKISRHAANPSSTADKLPTSGPGSYQANDYYFYKQRSRAFPYRHRKYLEEVPVSCKSTPAAKTPSSGVHPVQSTETELVQEKLPTIVLQKKSSVVDPYASGQRSQGPDVPNRVSGNADSVNTFTTDTVILSVPPWDSQRLMYYEYKSAAANLLAKLADYLYSRSASRVSHSNIPRFLEYQLLATWREMVTGIRLEIREWQTQAAKDIARKKLEKEALKSVENDSKAKDSDVTTNGHREKSSNQVRISSGLSESGGSGRSSTKNVNSKQRGNADGLEEAGHNVGIKTARKSQAAINPALLHVTSRERRYSHSSTRSSISSARKTGGGRGFTAAGHPAGYEGISEHSSEFTQTNKTLLASRPLIHLPSGSVFNEKSALSRNINSPRSSNQTLHGVSPSISSVLEPKHSLNSAQIGIKTVKIHHRKSGDHKGAMLTTLQFVLSSKDCLDRGWVYEDGSTIITYIEWALIRLQVAIKQKEESDRLERIAHSQTEPRVYLAGDVIPTCQPPLRAKTARPTSKLASASPHRSPPENTTITLHPICLPQPRWSQIDSPDIYHTVTNDGSSVAFYPDGQIAILSSHAGQSHTGFVLNIFDHSASSHHHGPFQQGAANKVGGLPETVHPLHNIIDNLQSPNLYPTHRGSMASSSREALSPQHLASFTPSGLGAVFYQDGTPRFVATDSACSLHNQRGGLVRRCRWPHPSSKLPVTILIRLNSYLTFRCVSKSEMTFTLDPSGAAGSRLVYTVGKDFDQVQEKQILDEEDEDHLVSGLHFVSRSAKELLKPAKKRKARKKDDKNYQQSLDELKKSMDMKESLPLEVSLDKDLIQYKKKIINLVESWHEHYRLHLHIVQPCFHAKDMPRTSVGQRVASLTPNRHTKSAGCLTNLRQSVSQPGTSHQQKKISRPITAAAGVLTTPSEAVPADILTLEEPARGSTAHVNFNSKDIQQTSISQSSEPLPPCPVVLRSQMFLVEHSSPYFTNGGFHSNAAQLKCCKCSKVQMPLLFDLEFDFFLQRVISPSQLAIVCVINSSLPLKHPIMALVEGLYEKANRGRTQPCAQSRADPFRTFAYDLARAAQNMGCTQPLLLRRHNVQPGMCLMYYAGRLVFADLVFNGYGSTRRDLVKQIFMCRSFAADSNSSFGLPSDFRFSYDKESRRWLSAVHGVCSPPSSHNSDSQSTLSYELRNLTLQSGFSKHVNSRLTDNLPQI